MQTEQHNNRQKLPEKALMAMQTWQSFPADKVAAYDRLMANEDFWDLSAHSHFSKVTYWHELGAA